MRRSEEGFALPSVLLLVTVLALVAASVIGMQYFMRQVVLMDAGQIKAEYAAESGVSQALAQVQFRGAEFPPSGRFRFDDESEAATLTEPWGLFFKVSSAGRFGRFSAQRAAIAADRLPAEFARALVFANPTHQLVFAGQSSIRGNVIVGQPGVTIGNLRNLSSPVSIPIDGTIDRQQSPALPQFESHQLAGQLKLFDDLVATPPPDAQVESRTLRFGSNGNTIEPGTIGDSIDHVFIAGDAVIMDSLHREASTLYIGVRGKAILHGSSRLSGLIVVSASGGIVVEEGSRLDRGILVSRVSIEIMDHEKISAQLIAPSIIVGIGCELSYPSIAYSVLSNPLDTLPQHIVLRENAKVEGTVMLTAATDHTPSENLIEIQQAASVIGAVYSNARITLDGSVAGVVLTKDFYFYDSPTTYLGWLRSGRIDRNSLPPAFLVPPGFSPNANLEVLQWL